MQKKKKKIEVSLYILYLAILTNCNGIYECDFCTHCPSLRASICSHDDENHFSFFLARMVEELDQGKNEWIHLETAVASW